MKALNDRCIIRKDPKVEETSGIVLTDKDAHITSIRGTILSVGCKVTQVKEGQRVIFNKYHGLDVADGEEVLLAIREEELLAVE